jgi:hypothetical protein
MSDRFGELHLEMARKHAVMRAAERTGAQLTPDDVKAHERLIEAYETEVLGFGAERRELHEVEDQGRTFFAVWCPNMRRIVTYLGARREWKGSFLEGKKP